MFPNLMTLVAVASQTSPTLASDIKASAIVFSPPDWVVRSVTKLTDAVSPWPERDKNN